MMTMVKKNGFDESPDQNYGATIFRKQKRKKKTKQEPIEPYQNDAPKGDNLETNVANKGKQLDKDQCMKNVLNFTKASREKREKRLYTHLGMRGISKRFKWFCYSNVLIDLLDISLACMYLLFTECTHTVRPVLSSQPRMLKKWLLEECV